MKMELCRKIIFGTTLFIFAILVSACKKDSNTFNTKEALNEWMNTADSKAKARYEKFNKNTETDEELEEIGLGKRQKQQQQQQQTTTQQKKKEGTDNVVGDKEALSKDELKRNTIMNATASITTKDNYNVFSDGTGYYFYTQEGKLYKKIDNKGKVIYKDKNYNGYDSFPAIGHGNELVSIENNRIVIKKFLASDENAFVYKIYSNDGNCYETRNPDGSELYQTAIKHTVYNGVDYITYYGGPLDEYVVVDEKLGNNGTMKAYLRGEYNFTIKPEVLFEHLSLQRNENQQQKLITSVLSTEVKKQSYGLALDNSVSSANSDIEEVNHLIELLKGGYIDLKSIESNTSSIFDNPYEVKAANKLKETNLFLVSDCSQIYFIMNEGNIKNYLKRFFDLGSSFIVTKDKQSKVTNENYINAILNFRIQKGNKDDIDKLKELQADYAYKLKQLAAEKEKGNEEAN